MRYKLYFYAFTYFCLLSIVFTDPCDICKDLVNEFNNGIKNTVKQNFGGGNTAWEEERLGNFATSETRLIHILENVCPSSMSNREKCQYLREEIEEEIEYWWFNTFRKDQSNRDLFNFLCIEKVKTCCPINHYGPSCQPCFSFNCSFHGECNGNGTRSGNGSCNCSAGYKGSFCELCDFGYYDIENECQACDESCLGCNGSSSNHCISCSNGFLKINETCIDINECLNTTCGNGEYCSNLPGSYQCRPCDEACANCTELGSENCVECQHGYQKINGKCEDINECSADSDLCREPGYKCTNIPGSYKCLCADDYVKNADGKCVVQEKRSKPSVKKTNSNFKKTNQQKNNKKRAKKKIWTRKFEREFFKMICCVVLLGLVSYFVGKYGFIVLLFSIVCGYYIFFKSIRLDQIFSKSFIL